MKKTVNTKRFAAIASDGTRDVVWSVGDSHENALDGAHRELHYAYIWKDVEPELVFAVIELTREQAAKLAAGESMVGKPLAQ